EPGGLFVFDVHTPAHLEGLDGGIFMDETEDAYCVWRTDYDPVERICTYAMDVFHREEDDLWYREGEVHEEYAYTLAELTRYLEEAGFVDICQYGNLKLSEPAEGEDRVFFTARKPE
ncbi:MAG: class I SAM-dependent methyltransferase, partial [Ruminiclostridium sp.]|nr:class I SAM-dependent methyltransferase [Ruminiclostridium sp.]